MFRRPTAKASETPFLVENHLAKLSKDRIFRG